MSRSRNMVAICGAEGEAHPERTSEHASERVYQDGFGAQPHRAREGAARLHPDLQAHLLGQKDRRRGLKGGPQFIQGAMVAYLNTQYAGPDDRRPEKGLLKRVAL